MEIKCLDHGFIRLVETMGTDGSIVQAARVSYGKGTKTVSRDRELIRYLLRHEHTSPFEMVELKFHCKMPLFVARQWIRHRTANVNEISGRYSIMEEQFYIPEIEDIKHQSRKNHQGRAEDEEYSLEDAKKYQDLLRKNSEECYRRYTNMLEMNVARELARLALPLNLYTEWYWKIDLHNLFRFIRLRMDHHAQKEIRVYAEAIAGILKEKFPICWEAFEDYLFYSRKMSRPELNTLKDMVKEEQFPGEIKGMGKLEYGEFRSKLF